MKLSVSSEASNEDLKSNFRALAKRCHPDLHADKIWATREFRELVADLKFRLAQPKSKAKPKSQPPPPKKKRDLHAENVMAAIGFSARIERGSVYITIRIKQDTTKVTINLLPDETGLLKIGKFEASIYYFNLDVPPNIFPDGRLLQINNLPFPCFVTITY